ncbi:LSU ribosomal protein L17P [Thermaerobacter marianensis DSM 12885]|uniref:Large ribosomal subunit protein bL17 n=1 Tax=Thermaerobacter marianensis (strain ATCC 700841 / DSM 12885 / JCM 10246 / 7p75a) TaxID=644966 RepID=E6SKX2_THEM7|nr:50S ribosomal protein L17 [Thermaerobacter marianensis]ADU52345.1 LSU ribosomal protein L17P [Thermaerobacter marianensis DSM 12885]
MGHKSRLNRPTDQRQAMVRSLVTSLFIHERIETTETRAREAQRLAEHLITLARRGDLHARRQAAAVLYDKQVLKKLFDVIGPRYSDRAGGYTRVLKLEPRRGDGAPMALLELV